MQAKHTAKRTSPRNGPRRLRAGFTLLELILSVVIIATVLLPLSDAVTNASLAFGQARNGVTAYDIANRIMNTLASEELPTFAEDQGYGSLSGGGSYYDFLQRFAPSEMDSMSELQLDEAERWKYEYIKDLIVVNKEGVYGVTEDGAEPDFGQIDYDEGRVDPDDVNAPTDPTELAKLTAARVIRIRLRLWMPSPDGNDGPPDEQEPTGEGEGGSVANRDPRRITLITFVDADDFKEKPNRSNDTPEDTPAPTSYVPGAGQSETVMAAQPKGRAQ